MFALFTRPRRRSTPARPRSTTRLMLERLETRDCPTAPALHATFQAGTGHNFRFYGNVADDNPSADVVNFSGAASGSATPNAIGYFDVTLTASSLGIVTAIAVNGQGQTSDPAPLQLVNLVPSVNGAVNYNQQRSVTLSGNVGDEDPTGCTVTFTGVVNGQTTPDSTGHYSYTDNAISLGTVKVTVTDPWLQSPPPLNWTVTSLKPSFAQFQAIEGPSYTWEFKGKVNDESPAGLTVVFGGLPSLAGKSVTLDSNGAFDKYVQLQAGENGTATADCTDWWGLAATQACATVQQI
jgi:hypothetical protein